MTRKRKLKFRSLISAHLPGIKRALLEGEKRPAFLAFLDSSLPAKQGIYALYDKKGRLYYSGKASDLPKRLNQHLKDRHGESWPLATPALLRRSLRRRLLARTLLDPCEHVDRREGQSRVRPL